MRQSEQIKKNIQRTWLYFLGLLMLTILSLVFYRLVRNTLMDDYIEVGTSMADRYAISVQSDLNKYQALLTYGVEGIDADTTENVTVEQMTAWAHRYHSLIEKVLGTPVIDAYMVFDGQLITATPDMDYEPFDYTQKPWYAQVQAAEEGEIIFTQAYPGTFEQRDVVSMAQKCKNSDTILVFDIYPDYIHEHTDRIPVPNDGSVYICDEKGTLLFAMSGAGTKDDMQAYVQQISDGVQETPDAAYVGEVTDADGAEQGIYHTSVSKVGWDVYVTVPLASLNQLHDFSLAFLLVLIPFYLILLYFSIRNYRLDRKVERAAETVAVLGKQFYAVYRINYRDDTYEMIKGSEYMKSKLPETGSYPEFLQTIIHVLKEDVQTEFVESFSAAHIRKLVAQNLSYYGGDFERLFGDTYRWVNVQVLFDADLDNDEVVLCFRDVDQKMRAQMQERELLQNAMHNAIRSEKTKQAFFSNMSHDMRTPLNAILSLSKLALEHKGDCEAVHGYVEKIRFSGKQLLDLINDILDMSRMEQGKVVLNNQHIDLVQTIGTGIANFTVMAETEGKQFTFSHHIRHRHVMGDPMRIHQILNNLISNAFKFTDKGDSITVTLEELEGPGRTPYRLTVSDTGIGMSEAYLPQLFEPYSREPRFSSRPITGTGLGMPIVKSLVTEMSGQIYVESAVGEGTTFTLTIPFASTDEPSETVSKPQKADTISLQGRKILLAEDNLINMEIATEMLRKHGVTIVQAWNGEEAVTKFSESQPFELDAILMDMQMPKLDGCGAAEQIRALERPDAETIPIIAVTANAFAEDIAATTAAGMNAHISKPIDFKALCETLARLMQ